MGEYHGAVLGADVVALAIERGRVVNGEEGLQQGAIVDQFGIEAHLHYLGMPRGAAAYPAVIGILQCSAGIARNERLDADELIERGFEAPEAAAAQCGNFGGSSGVRLRAVFAVHSILPQRKVMGQTMVFGASGVAQTSFRRSPSATQGSTPVSLMQPCVDDQVRR